jgi:hypothetical protein
MLMKRNHRPLGTLCLQSYVTLTGTRVHFVIFVIFQLYAESPNFEVIVEQMDCIKICMFMVHDLNVFQVVFNDKQV